MNKWLVIIFTVISIAGIVAFNHFNKKNKIEISDQYAAYLTKKISSVPEYENIEVGSLTSGNVSVAGHVNSETDLNKLKVIPVISERIRKGVPFLGIFLLLHFL